MKSTIQYLIDNDLHPNTALTFTCNDLYFLSTNNLDELTINKGKGSREETLNKEEVLSRIKELYDFVEKFEGNLIISKPLIDRNLIIANQLNKAGS